MHVWPLVLGVCLVTGCQTGEPPPPPVVPMVEDLSLEQLSLKQNGSMFEETYGLPVLLRMAK